VDGLRLAARQIGGGKEGSTKHKRKQSGLPLLEGTLALGYTYIDILDEENDGIILTQDFSYWRYPGASNVFTVSEPIGIANSPST
jgi:hypothetical protein